MIIMLKGNTAAGKSQRSKNDESPLNRKTLKNEKSKEEVIRNITILSISFRNEIDKRKTQKVYNVYLDFSVGDTFCH